MAWTSNDLYPRELADVNGDGKADFVGFASTGVYVSLATGDGKFADPVLGLAAFGSEAGGWASNDLYPRAVADVNGDGKADIVGFASTGVYVSLATGDGKFADPVLRLAAFGREAGGWTSNDLYPRALADVTADRKADIVGFGAAGVQVSIALDASGPIPFSSTSSGGMLGSTAQLVQATASFGASGAGDTLNKAVSGDDPLEPSFLVAPQRA